LILGPDGSLKLIDFMVAQQSADTATATVVGKHAYLPPEQFRGRAIPRSDIYAFGCTLFYLLTGKDPEPLTSSHPIFERDTVSGAMDTLVATATDLDLNKRFACADDVRQALIETCLPDNIELTEHQTAES
jgi:serine/threonine protein kinase